MRIALERLRPDSAPVRRRQSAADDASLEQSMAAAGQIVPIVVIPIGRSGEAVTHYEVKEGNRRLAIATRLKWDALEAHVLDVDRAEHALAAAIAANTVRAHLAPVDAWRALQQLLAKGYSLAGAAETLGLTERRAAQLHRLSCLHPKVLELLEASTLPAETTLRTIANAPQELQAKALQAKGALTKSGPHITVDWSRIAEACRRQRISRSLAAFDAEASGLAFTRDPFVPPGDPDEWTTDDVAGFLEHQRGALMAEAASAKGKIVVVTESNRDPGMPSLPAGWRQSFGKADKPTKRETVYACVASRTGAIVRVTAVDQKAERERERHQAERKAAASKATTPAAAAAPAPPAEPPAPPPATRIPSAVGTVTAPIGASSTPAAEEPDTDPDDDPAPAAAQEAAKAHLTKSGQLALAEAKTAGLHARLRDPKAPLTIGDLLAMLVLAIHAPNVRVDHYGGPTGWDAHKGRDLVARLVGPDGHLRYSEPELEAIARETLARVLSFDRPAHGYSPYNNRSGATAEWIAASLIIDPGTHLPRLDTAELLAGCEAAVLKEAAAAAGIKFTTATTAKRELVGKLEHWRPAFAQFGAPGPRPKAAS